MNVPSGYSALDLVGFTDKGDYLPSATYVKNDLVHYNDKIWKCLIDDTTAIEPTEGVNWTLWIQQSNSLDGLADVEITNAQDGQEITYDGTTQKWKNTSKIQTLTNQVKDMNNVLGAKNLLPFPYFDISKTEKGITWTVNSDGSISASGTATANSFFRFTQDSDLSIYNNTILSGCPANGDMWSKWALYLTGKKDEQYITKKDVGSGVLIEDIPAGYPGGLYAKVVNGQTVNLTFYPMIRPASIQDDTYVPYSMTNREMTPYVQAISNPNLLDNPWFTVNQRGANQYTTPHTYTFDRWRNLALSEVNVVSGGISLVRGNDSDGDISNYGALTEPLETDLLQKISGKTITLSVMKSDGTIVSSTGVFTYNANYDQLSKTDNDINIAISSYNVDHFFIVRNTTKDSALTIKAVKLELGSVSTLAMDTAPNYATELLKCQRYFHKYATQSFRPSNMYDCIPEMRANPTQSTIVIDGTTYYVNSADL